MPGRLSRLRLSDQLALCKKCGREFRGEEMKRHTDDSGNQSFYLKPASIPSSNGQEV